MKEAKKSKKIFLGAVAVAIAAMMVIPTGITMANNTTDVPFGVSNAKKMPFEIKELGTSEATTENAGNILITPNSPEDDVLPAITKDGNGNIAVVWSHKVSPLEGNMGLSYSTDGGTTWTGNIIELEGFQYYADIAYFEGSKYDGPAWDGLWVECLDLATNGGNFILIPDVTDSSTYEAYAWTEGTRPGATCLNFEDDMWYKEFHFDLTPGPVVAMINDDQGMEQGLELWWMAAGDDLGNIVYNWDSGTGPEGEYFPASDIDTAAIHDSDPAWTDNDFFYVVCQSDVQDKSQILYKRCVPTIEDDIEFAESYFLDGGDTYDASHPNVVASGDNVAVVYMTNDNVYGDWDIRCKYSSDHGQNWGTSTVAGEHMTDEMYPAAYMSGNTVFVVYIRDGNLYLVKSEDGGATWGDPIQVNDEDGTVVAEENAVDLQSGGIVWVDNRNGNNDIYYAPLPMPVIGIPSISGGMGVKATVANTGTEDASSVDWSIQLSGLIFVGKEATGTIDTLAAGSETTISTGLVFGIGPTTITVTAGGASKTASGFVLGPLVLGVK